MPEENISRVHFIGIGGIGMSSLARHFLAKKWLVSGSDISNSNIVKELRKSGATVKIGHSKANVPEKAIVIYNQAIPKDNPELVRAYGLGIVPLSYPQAIGLLTKAYKTIAVAGSHGKSTTTALLALIFENAGLDPTVIIGAKLKEFGNSNFREGKSDILVLEADEYGRAFHHYSPFAAVVTNIDREHLDVYKNISGVKKSFLKFISNIKPSGILVLNKEDKNILSLKAAIQKITRRKRIKAIWYSPRAEIKKYLAIPGAHNLSNASGAFELAAACGIPWKKIIPIFESFSGAWRRLEYRGEFRKSPVFDDYGHHPSEIKATLQALREKYPGKNLLCAFQPHQAARLSVLFRDFADSFDSADKVILLDVYGVAGRDNSSPTKTSADLATEISKKIPGKAFNLAEPKRIRKIIAEALGTIAPGSPVVMMGAGDIVKYTKFLVTKKG